MAFWTEFLFSLDFFIILSSIIFVLYLALTWNNDYFTKRNIPHEKPLPLLGSMAPLFFKKKSFADFSKDIYKAYEGHPFCGLFQFTTPLFMIRDPDLLKKVTVKDFEHFTDHVNFIPEDGDPVFAANLFSRKGQKWKHMRATLSPAFTSSKMKAMYFLIKNCGKQLADYVEDEIKISGEKVISVEMKDLFTRYTNDVIATCAFGVECNSLKDKSNKFYLTGKELTDMSGIRVFIFFGYMLFAKIMSFLRISFLPQHCIKFLSDIVKDTIKTRESKHIVRPDMIHLLMQARRGELKSEEDKDITYDAINDTKTDKPILSDADIAGQTMVFFFAGFDTASTLLCFSSLLLAMHPDVQQRVQEEIDRALRENNGEITYEVLHSMKYLDMVVSESLRLYPPVYNIDRECTKTYTIPASDKNPSVTLKAKDSICIPIYGIHRDEKYYPDPEKFDPERFNDENKSKINPFTYMPFGLGPRTCIGNRLALMEDKIALVFLLSKFSFVVIDKSPVPIKLTTKGFNLTVDNGFWMGLRLRSEK